MRKSTNTLLSTVKHYTSISDGIIYFVAQTSKTVGENGSSVFSLGFVSCDFVTH